MAVRFDSSTDALVATSGVPTGTFTITCWAKISVRRNTFETAVAVDANNTSNFLILQTNGDNWTLAANGPSEGGNAITVGAWVRLAAVVSGSTMTFYFENGSGGLSSSTDTVGSSNPAGFTRFRAGGSSFSGEWLNGCVAALKVWTAALSAGEVAAELEQYAPVRTAGLFRYHPFIDSRADESGNGHPLPAGSSAVTYESGPDIPEGAAEPPTVDAGPDVTDHIRDTEFTRTATDDDNGATITGRAWTIQSGPTGAGTTIGTAAALSWTPTVTGAYVLRYSATNSAGTGTDDVAVTVVDPPPVGATPALVIGQSATVTVPDGSVSVALPAPATAGNLIVFAFGGDKSMGALTMTSAGAWAKPVELGSGDSTLYLAYLVAAGGEQTITASLAVAAAGGRAWVGEYAATGGAWTVAAQATNPSAVGGAEVTAWATGTTGAATLAGLAVAVWGIDTAENVGTPAYSDDFGERLAEVSGGVTSRGGLWVAERDVLAGSQVGSTLTRSGTVQADQMSGAVVVFAREAPNRTLTSTWLGIDTVLARTSGEAADTVRVAFSTDSGMGSPTYSEAATPDSRGVTKHAVPGALAADTDHWYQVERGGTLLGTPRAFRTLPADGVTQTYAFGFGSCRDHIGDAPILADAIGRGVSFFVQHGDLHYRDITVNDQATFHNAYDELHTRTQLNTLLTGTPTAYTWSDHDGPVDATSNARPAAQAVYRQRVPHPALPSAAGIYHTFRVGRVRFVILDTRSYASPATNSDGSSKTKLGAEQKTWLQGLLAAADTPLTMIVSAEGWVGGFESGQDHWGMYQNERSQVGAWITASDTTCVMLCGDAHMLAVDDGSNSVAAVAVWHAAALGRAGSTKGGPYSGGTLAGSGQYGFVEIADTGQQVTATYRGIRSDGTVWQSHTVTVATPLLVDTARGDARADRPVLAQRHPLTLRPAAAAVSATRPAVAQAQTIAADDARAAAAASVPTLGQSQAVDVSAARDAAAADRPLLGQASALTVDDARAATRAPSVNVTSLVKPARAATTATAPALTQAHAVTVDGARAAATASAVDVDQNHPGALHDGRAAARTDRPTLTQRHTLAVGDPRATTTADASQLDHHQAVTVDGARTATTGPPVQLDQAHPLAVRPARAGTSAAGLGLEQDHVLTVGAGRAAAVSTRPLLGQGTGMVVRAARAAAAADVPLLDQIGDLEVAQPRSPSEATTPLLGQHSVIALSDARAAAAITSPPLALPRGVAVPVPTAVRVASPGGSALVLDERFGTAEPEARGGTVSAATGGRVVVNPSRGRVLETP